MEIFDLYLFGVYFACLLVATYYLVTLNRLLRATFGPPMRKEVWHEKVFGVDDTGEDALEDEFGDEFGDD